MMYRCEHIPAAAGRGVQEPWEAPVAALMSQSMTAAFKSRPGIRFLHKGGDL